MLHNNELGYVYLVHCLFVLHAYWCGKLLAKEDKAHGAKFFLSITNASLAVN
jgi:hypothetical protein